MSAKSLTCGTRATSAARIVSRFRTVEAEIYSQWPSINELLCLLVNEGVGRTHILAFEDEPTMVSEFLHLNAHDLETISLLEGSNHLTLWRFAVKSNVIRKTARVMSWSPLDEFGLYRKNKLGNRCCPHRRDFRPRTLFRILRRDWLLAVAASSEARSGHRWW